MATKIVTANGVYDLSNVTSLKELREEIDFLKASLKKDEQELEERLHKMPHHALKATADAVLPTFINKMIANGSWKLLASGIGVLANPFQSKKTFSKNLVGSAKKIGFMALMKGAYNFWRNKKMANPKTVTPGVTTSKPVSATVKKIT
jgi:hypothetical protein